MPAETSVAKVMTASNSASEPEAVSASLNANVRTPEIQVEGGRHYGTREVGAWIANHIL